MSMKDAKASNWVAERADTTATSFDLKGTTKSYTTFSKSFSAGQTVFYSAHDEDGNRESGYGEFDGSTVITRNPTATLVNGIYDGNAPSKVDFTGEVTVACTFNASAFNTLWAALDAIDPDGDGSINIPPELINGLIDSLNSKAEQADLEKEIQDRIDGDQALQDQIDALDPDGDRKVDWSEIDGKPAEFPPEAHDHDGVYAPVVHGHEIDDINGLQDALDASGGTAEWDAITGKPAEFPPETHAHEMTDVNGLQDALDSAGGTADWNAITNKPVDFPPEAHTQGWDTITDKPAEYPPESHTHQQGDVDGLESRLETIEDSITSGGGFVDAPDDGKLYGRQSESWAEVVIPDGGASSWDEIADKPTEFPPAAHDQGWDTITDKPTEFPPSAHAHAWADVTGKPSEFPPESHTHVVAEITDFDPLDYQPVGDYATTTYVDDSIAAIPATDLTGYATETYVDDSIAAIEFPEGTGSSVHIGETAPADPQEGQQWMEVPTDGDATMWIYANDMNGNGFWLQQPGGKDGAAGLDGNIADGTAQGIVATWDSTANSGAGQWTPDSSLTIDSTGDATFSANIQYLNGVDATTQHIISSRNAGNTVVSQSRYHTLNSGGGNTGGAIGHDGEHLIMSCSTSIEATKHLTIDSAGRVGIGGIDAPEKNLHVKGSKNNGILLDDTDNNIKGIFYSSSSDDSVAIGSISDSPVKIWTNNAPRLTIDAAGDATFSGNVLGRKFEGFAFVWPDYDYGLRLGADLPDDNRYIVPATGDGLPDWNNSRVDLGQANAQWRNAHFSGTVNSNFLRSQRVIQDGSPVIDAKGLIKTLSTLRNATKDETTLEGLRDSIGNAIGGLIEEFENQIAEMPAGDEA